MTDLKKNLDALQKIAKERTVKTQNIEYDLETIVKKVKKGVIKLNPDYQRKHRWPDDVSSKLIESLILNIPVPLIYISQDVDVDDETEEDVSRYSVIDGQQRLTAICNFFNGGFGLQKLDVLKELNGSHYNDLPQFLIRRLEERTIRCLRIDSTADTQVKYDIFERLNSGSVKLEAQELRNATCRGPFKSLIKKLAVDETFKSVAKITTNKTDKMEDQELVLRYFALTWEDGYKDYKGGFKSFLTGKMNEFNKLSESELNEMEHSFHETLKLIEGSLGGTPFAKYKLEDNGEHKRVSRFNAAVFDSIIVPFSKAGTGCTLTPEDMQGLFSDSNYYGAVSGSVSDVAKLNQRIGMVLEMAVNE